MNKRENDLKTLVVVALASLMVASGAPAAPLAGPMPGSQLANSGSENVIEVAVRGPRGAVAVRGPRGNFAARGPRGGVVVGRPVGGPGPRVGYGRGGGWARPGWYRWAPGGAIAAGAALGFIAAATVGAWAGPPPGPGYCWYYTDPSQTQGFWDACP